MTMVEQSNPPLDIDRGLDWLAVSVRRRAPLDAALLLEDEAPESILCARSFISGILPAGH
jgi:hypothetical protein